MLKISRKEPVKKNEKLFFSHIPLLPDWGEKPVHRFAPGPTSLLDF